MFISFAFLISHSFINVNILTMLWLNCICLIKKKSLSLSHCMSVVGHFFLKHHFAHSIRTGSWNGLRTSFTQLLSRLILYILTVLWRRRLHSLYIFFVVIWYDFSLVLQSFSFIYQAFYHLKSSKLLQRICNHRFFVIILHKNKEFHIFDQIKSWIFNHKNAFNRP